MPVICRCNSSLPGERDFAVDQQFSAQENISTGARGRAVFSYALTAHRLETFQARPSKQKRPRRSGRWRGPGGRPGWGGWCCGSAARHCHPPGSTHRPGASSGAGTPRRSWGCGSAEAAGGDLPFLPQTFPAQAPALASPSLSHPCSKSLSYFPPAPPPDISLSVLARQIPFLISSSRSQPGKGPPELLCKCKDRTGKFLEK